MSTWRNAIAPPVTLASLRAVSGVFGSQRARPRPQSKDYIRISVQEDFERSQFNTVENQVTRSVDIAGVKLIWDALDDEYGLMAYQGRGVLDIRSLTLFADQVIIRSPLRFPGTTVIIYARQLIFEGQGSIDTSPQDFVVSQAVSTNRTSDGLHPADANQVATYVAADGLHGEKAGDVHLHVQQIVEPSPGATRFICEGSAGQRGEDGGYKPYAPVLEDQPSAEHGPHLDPVTVEDIKNHLKNHFVAKTWYWPPHAKKPKDRRRSVDTMELDGDVLKKKQVVHLKLIARDDGLVTNNVTRTLFPGGEMKGSPGCAVIPPPGNIPCVNAVQNDFVAAVDSKRLRPGHGRDAYASGRPGNGGDGGSVVVYGSSARVEEQACRMAPGEPGAPSKKIEADPPGTPNPAFWVELLIVKQETFGAQSPREPEVLKLENVSGKPGLPAPSREGTRGKAGALKRVDGAISSHPNTMTAVLAYARDAYRNGWREDADAILRPYFEDLEAGDRIPAALLPMRTELVAMRSNMENNFDYFGNPVGWVPRLNVTTNFELFKRERANSSQLLFFAARLLSRWDELERKQAFATSQSAAFVEEIDLLQTSLEAAFDRLGPARKQLEGITADLQKVGARLETLHRRAMEEAKNHLKAMQLFEGFLKLAGGLAKVIPWGQPYLGMGGDVLTSISDFEWTDSAGNFSWDAVGKSIGTFAEDLGGKTDGFLAEHKKTTLAGQEKGLRRKLKDANGAIKLLDGKVEAVQQDIEREWRSLRQPEIDLLKSRIADADAAIQSLKAGDPQIEVLQRNTLTFQEELRLVATERMDAARLRLQRELTSAEATRDAEAAARKAELQESIDKLTERRKNLTSKIEGFKSDAALAKEKTEASFEALSKLGDGIAGIGAGVRALLSIVEDDDPRVLELMENLQNSDVFKEETKKEIKAVKAELDRINRDKQAAATEFLVAQQAISSACALISSNLSEVVALSQQRQRTSWALDIRTRQFLQNMEQRARERLQHALYEFVRAYQYEFLSDVSDDFYNFRTWVDRLNALEAGDGATPTEAQFRQIEDEVLHEQYVTLARDIVVARQRYAAVEQNRYDFELTDEMLATLATRGSVTFNMVEELRLGNFEMVEWRIRDLDLREIGVEASASSLSLNIDFVHSGMSILRSTSGDAWFFQQGRGDQPISWRFVYNHGGSGITKNTSLANDPDATLSSALTGNQVQFRDYWPAMSSNITLWINRGHPKPVELLTAITKMKITVHYSVR